MQIGDNRKERSLSPPTDAAVAVDANMLSSTVVVANLRNKSMAVNAKSNLGATILPTSLMRRVG